MTRNTASRPSLNRARWQRTRRLVRQRDNNCQRCGATEKLSVHHIVRPQDGGSDRADNLLLLCDRCHRRQHKTPRFFGNASSHPSPRFSRNSLAKLGGFPVRPERDAAEW
jgi:5-methylcytosine-specific restriction endonuclease McrA